MSAQSVYTITKFNYTADKLREHKEKHYAAYCLLLCLDKNFIIYVCPGSIEHQELKSDTEK